MATDGCKYDRGPCVSLVQDIDRLLPQTQCQACGFNGCRPYAQALASGLASPDKCPPGGLDTLKRLGALLKVDVTPYLERFDASLRPPSEAYIREEACIGCAKCINVCPVDAIVGAAKHMHHVIADECTGCGLCVESCPVDCIEMIEIPQPKYSKNLAREHYEARIQRLDKEARGHKQHYQHDKMEQATIEAKKAYIQEALARIQQKKR